MRDFLYSVKLPNLVQGVNARREASMKAENLALYHCS
jgi:hypothetical protein